MASRHAGSLGRAGQLLQCISPRRNSDEFVARRKLCLARKSRPMSEENRILVQQMINMLAQKETPTRADVGDLLKILHMLPGNEDLLREVDTDKQLNLLQWTVVRNCYQLLQELLSGDFAICLNCWSCNGPLHLACKFGYTGIVQLLLHSGASPVFESTACYPSTVRQLINHTTLSSSHAHQASCRLKPRYTPLQCALMHDQLNVLKVLLDHPRSWDSINTDLLLIEACKFKSVNCIQYTISVMPHTFNCRITPSGKTVLYQVLVTGNNDCLSLVLSNGQRFTPDIQLNASGTGDSVLHVLYGHSAEVSRKMYETTALLEEGGFSMNQLIRSRDSVGNTPLHVLARYIGASDPRCRRNNLERNDQEDANEQAYNTVKYLMEKGADVSAINNLGQTPLHLLFDDNGRRPLFRPTTENINNSVPIINRVLKLLLEASVKTSNLRSDYSTTVLNNVTTIICGMELCAVKQCGHHFIQTVQILLEYGVDPDLVNGKDIHVLTELLTAANRWLTHSVTDSQEASAKVLDLLHSFLLVLFEGGMKPPVMVLKLAVKQIAIMTNIAFDSRSLCKRIGQLLFPIYVAGLNPNKGGVMMNNWKNEFFLARGLVLHRHGGGILEFFDALEQVLNQSTLNRLINALCDILRTEFKGSVVDEESHACEGRFLDRMRREPRSLLSTTRICVNDLLDWNLQNIKYLPLPPALKGYLREFE